MRNKKQITAAVLAALMTAAMPVHTFAGPAANEAAEEVTDTLSDNLLEYSEISGRIQNFNADYKKLNTTLTDAYLNLDAAKDLASEASELMEDAKDLKPDEGGMDAETKALYEEYRESARSLRKQAQSLTNDDLPSSAERTLRQTKNKLAKTVENLMIQYQGIVAQTEVAEKNVEYMNVQAARTQRMAGENLATQADVLTAQEGLRQAEAEALRAKSGRDNLRQTILVLLGWDANADVTFAPIPQPDPARIEAMNLDNDKQSAIWANYELQEIKRAGASGTAGRAVKKRSVSMTEQTVSLQIEKLYTSVIAKKQAYDAAVNQFTAATQEMESGARMLSLGMVSQSDYVGIELAYLSAKASYENASLTLFKAMEDYDWAVKGLFVSNGG